MKSFKSVFNKKFMIAFLGFIMLLVGCSLLFSDDSSSADNSIVYKDYTILDSHYGKILKYDSSHVIEGYQGGNTAYYIIGKITAKDNKKLTIITFNLYDNNDVLLGTAVAGLPEMKVGKEYDFKAVSLIKQSDVQKIDHYKIKDIK